jgi:hypothetical protein
MKRLIFVVAMLCSSIALADQPAHEFKGLSAGMSYESALANPKLRLRCDENYNKPIADKLCHLRFDQNETIAGAPVKNILVSFYDDQLSEVIVYFRTRDFFLVKGALIEKFGKGLSKESVVQNRMGASFDNETVTWLGDNDVMELIKRSGDVDQAVLRIHSKNHLEEYKKRLKKDAGDL